MRNKLIVIISIVFAVILLGFICHFMINYYPENNFEEVKSRIFTKQNEIKTILRLSKNGPYLLRITFQSGIGRSFEVFFNESKVTPNTFPYTVKDGDEKSIYIFIPEEKIRRGKNSVDLVTSGNSDIKATVTLRNFRKKIGDGFFVVFSGNSYKIGIAGRFYKELFFVILVVSLVFIGYLKKTQNLFVNAIQFCFSDKEFGMRRKILPEKPPSDYIMFPFIGLLVFFVFMPFYTNIFYTWHDYFLFTDFPHVYCKFISKMLQGRMAQGRFLSGFTWIALNYLQLKIQDIRLIAVLIKLLQFVNASLFCFFLYKIYVKISRNWKFAILVTILTINLTGFLFYFVTNYTVIINSFIFVPLISVCLVADHRKSIIRNKKTFFFAILLCCASLSSYNWHAFVVPSFAVFTLLFAPITTEEKYRTAINILTIFFFACIVYFVFTKILILSLQLLPPNESHAFKFSFQNIINGLSFHFHYVLNFWFLNKGLFEKFYIIPQIVLIFAIILFIRQEFILSKHKFSVLAFRFGIMICAIGFCQSYFVVCYPHFVRIHLGLALMCLFFCVWLVQKALKKIDTLGGFNISVAISVLMIFIVIAAGHFNQNHYYIKPAQNEFAFIKGALTPLKEGLVDVVRIKKGPYLWIQHDTYGSTVFSRFEFASFAVRGLVSHAYSDLHGLPSTLSSINNSVLNFQIDDKKQYFDISEKNGRNKNVILTFDGAGAHAITKSAMRRTVISLPPVRRQVTLVQEGYCGYNIIKLDQRFMAIRQDLGPLHLGDGRLADIKAWPYIISGDATVAVNEEIVKRGGDISQYKVFDYKGGVVAANVSLGKVDPTTELIGTSELPPFLFVGWTKEEVLKKVDTRSEK